jgi:hypothetical protein
MEEADSQSAKENQMPDLAHRLATVPFGLHPSLGFSQSRGGGAEGSAAASIEADRADALVILGPGGTYAGSDFAERIDASAWTAFGVLNRTFGSATVPHSFGFTVQDGLTNALTLADENGDQYLHVRTSAPRVMTYGNATTDPLHLLIGSVRHDGVLSPTQLTGDQTDYAPAGFDACYHLRQDVDGTPRVINSLAGGVEGRTVLITNIGSSTLTLLHDDGATGTASMRFIITGAASRVLAVDESVFLFYDDVTDRWRVVG